MAADGSERARVSHRCASTTKLTTSPVSFALQHDRWRLHICAENTKILHSDPEITKSAFKCNLDSLLLLLCISHDGKSSVAGWHTLLFLAFSPAVRVTLQELSRGLSPCCSQCHRAGDSVTVMPVIA